MAFKKKEIQPDFTQLTIFLIGEPKTGKSTLVRDLILLTGGQGVFMQMGNENATTLLDGILVSENETWKDILENVEILAKRKSSGDPELEKVKFVAIDTADEFFKILEQEAIKVANQEAMDAYQSSRNQNKGFKPVRTILQAFGGYNKGRQYTADDLATSIATKLRKAGLGVIFVGHSAVKTVKRKDELESVDFEVVTSSLDRTYDKALTNISDLKMVITQHYDDEDYETEIRAGFGTEKEIKHATSLGKKRVYFRETPAVSAGGRFSLGAVPVYLEFENGMIDAKKIKETIEEGMRLSKHENMKERLANLEKEEYKITEAEMANMEMNATIMDSIISGETPDFQEDDLSFEETPVSVLDYEQLKKDIQNAYRSVADPQIKEEVQKIVKQHGSISKMPDEVIKEVSGMLGLL